MDSRRYAGLQTVMDRLDSGAPRRGQRSGISWIRSVWLNAIAARIVFLAPYVVTHALAPSGFANGADRPLPPLTTLLAVLGSSARSYIDFSWYRLVAKSGYVGSAYVPGQQSTIAFFPLQPALMRVVRGPALLEFAIGSAAFLLSARLVFAVFARTTSAPVAHRATLFLIYFPFSFCMAQFRPEAWLLLFGALATLLSLQGRPWLSAAAGMVAGLAKPNGIMVAALTGRAWLPPEWRGAPIPPPARELPTFAATAAPFVGVLVMAGLGAVYSGDALAFAKVQQAWLAAPILRPAEQAWRLVTHPLLVGRLGWDAELLHWAVLAVALLAIIALVRRRLYPHAMMCLGFVLLTFVNFGVWMLGKHLAACFPLFLGLALAVRGRGTQTAWIAVSASLLAANGVFNALELRFTMV